MSSISLAMIVRNEEKYLSHCLLSVCGLADEIVVVDTGSTDGTIEIAKSYNAKVFNFEWVDDFSEARNYSLSHCTGDWVLILDADEAIDKLDHNIIKEACEQPFADAYLLILRNYISKISTEFLADSASIKNESNYTEGKNYPYFVDALGIRLARRFDGLYFKNKIHETLDFCLAESNKKKEPLSAVIHHYGKLITDRVSHKQNYYLQLAQEEVKLNPGNVVSLFNLMQQALVANNPELAIQAGTSAIAAGGKTPLILFGLASALQVTNKHEEAIKYLDMLLAMNPKHVPGLVRKGDSLAASGEYELARSVIQHAIDLEPSHPGSYAQLANLERLAGRFDDARKAINIGLKFAPDEPKMLDILIRIDFGTQNYTQAAQNAWLAINRCPTGGNGAWHHLVASFLAQGGETQKAKAIVEMGLKAFPDNDNLIGLSREL